MTEPATSGATQWTVAEIHDRLRGAILRGELAAGDPLSQVRLARELGVGRTPLREALRMLQREGLVEGEYNHRVRVAPFSLSDLEQVYAMRILLEALAVRTSVPSFSEDDLARLTQAVRDMDEAARSRDLDAWEPAHRRLHLGLAQYTGDRIVEQVRTLLEHAQRYRHLFIRNDPISWGVGAHFDEGIVEACQRRDAPDASRLLALQLARAAFAGVAYLAPGYDPAIIRSAVRIVIGERSELPGPWVPTA
jgi:DNA-binding GntR family transcriptional regulator